jgi:hypothetical protein
MSSAETGLNSQDKEKRTQETIAGWEKFFIKQIEVTVIGKSCSVNCEKAIVLMGNLQTHTNIDKLTPDIASKISDFFSCKENIYPITLGMKKIDEMGYNIKELGPIIEEYTDVNNTIGAPIATFPMFPKGTSTLEADRLESSVITYRPHPSGFLCLVEKKPA